MAVFSLIISAKTWFLFIFLYTSVFSKENCNYNVNVKQILLNEGYHRNITYGIVLSDEENDDWLFRNCQVGIDQRLPSGVYVNSDELDELRRIRRVNAMTRKRINIELPAEESRATSAYLVGSVKDNKVNLWLPVHARYAKSKPGGGTSRNTIMPPKVFLRCPDQRLDVCEKSVPPTTTFLCNGASEDKCSVMELKYTVMTDTLIWDVPVGDLEHYYAVAFGTSLAVMSASLYLIRAIHEAKMHLRNLLKRL